MGLFLKNGLKRCLGYVTESDALRKTFRLKKLGRMKWHEVLAGEGIAPVGGSAQLSEKASPHKGCLRHTMRPEMIT